MSVMLLNSFISFPASGVLPPSAISGLDVWCDVDNLSGLSNDDPVGGSGSEFSDRSGNGNDFTQGTGTKQPLYKTNIQNSKPGLLFDGTDDFMELTGYSDTQPTTYVVVCNPDTGSDNIFDGRNTTVRNALIDSGGTYNLFAGSVENTGKSYLLTPLVCMAVFNTTSSDFYVNNETAVTGLSVGSQGISSGINMGSNEAGSGNFFKGYMFEFLVYNAALTSTDWTNLKGYFNTKWGLGL